MARLSGQAVLISGATSGIGLAATSLFVREGSTCLSSAVR